VVQRPIKKQSTLRASQIREQQSVVHQITVVRLINGLKALDKLDLHSPAAKE